MSIRGGTTRGQKRKLTGNDSQPAGDIRSMMRRVLESRTVCPHDDSQYELNTEDMRIIMMQPHPSTLVPETLVANPYSRLRHMDWATTSDGTDVEQQLPPHEECGDVGDSEDIPLPDSHEVPQPDSHEVPPHESKDVPHPEDPALPVLKENKVWTICIFGFFIFMHVYV